MRYLAIDYGTTYMGLALGDNESKLATPFDTVRETDFERQLSQIEQLIFDESIDEIVVGYPLTLEGGESDQTATTMDFITELSGKVSIPVHKEDERLSSKFAQKLKQEYGGGSHDEHALAATTILQIFLDRE